MSPLDDQLHDVLHGRASALAPPADPMAGIERRASGIRRRRLAATVAGGALLIAGVAVVVPALQPGAPSTRLIPATAPPSAPQEAVPSNVLSTWPTRGTSTGGPAQADVRLAFARAFGRDAEVTQVRFRELFVAGAGQSAPFTVGQAWFVGDQSAYQVSYAIAPNGPEFFLGPQTMADPAVLAFQVPDAAGTSYLLAVVPQPQTGQVLYDDNSTGAFRPVTGQDQRDGVVLIDRSPRATNDRLQLLDGNGDLDHPTFEGSVASLLCGARECG